MKTTATKPTYKTKIQTLMIFLVILASQTFGQGLAQNIQMDDLRKFYYSASINSLHESEESQAIEHWMTDFKEWNVKNESAADINSYMYTESEQEQELENWMLIPFTTEATIKYSDQVVEEEEIEIEPWMTNLDAWYSK
ncbi:MAG: hypothetical protein JXJ22_02275 [Bacteroidales bacterium]|nr:hypothetical protein [Bacteroidales bacterium]